MTISSSGFNPIVTPQQTVFEKQTTGQHDLKNTGEVRGNVTILPQSQSDSIPFTKLDDHNKWDYKSEPENPTLMPNITLRGAGADVKTSDEGVQAHAENLFAQMTDDVKLELAGLPTTLTAALRFVIDIGANTLEWQDKALIKTQSENALARVEENKKAPHTAYEQSLKLGTEIAGITEKWVQEIGQNDPGFIDASEFLEDTKNLLKGTSHDAKFAGG
jgi:hypothetical protein